MDLADSLKLDDDRRHTIGTIFDRMHAEAVRIGTEIVRLEAELDSAFAEGAISAQELEQLVNGMAGLRGELRYVHLAAHLEVTALLSEHEIHEYQRLRGYVHDQHMHGN